MSRLSVCFIFVVIGVVLCNHLGNFEGSYRFRDGSLFYVCQNGVKVQGTFGEVGIFRGGANDGVTATGNYWSAGRGPCVIGRFEMTLTDFGIRGQFLCNLNGTTEITGFNATRLSTFRPNVELCAPTSQANTTLEGRWIDSDGLELHLCFRTPDDDDSDDDDDTVHASLQRKGSDGTVIDWFLTGYHVDRGRTFVGTWYQDFSAGAALFFLRDNGEINYFWWTGLVFDQGRTFIDGYQRNNPALHGIGSYRAPVRVSDRRTTSRECGENRILEPFILKNLPRDDDDNFYYFVDTEYLDEIRYINVGPFESSAVSIVTSIGLLFVALFMLLSV